MKKAIKKHGKVVQAYKLSDDKHPIIKELIDKGLIRRLDNGNYEIFSQEAINGSGQVTPADYFIRIDSANQPYPNSPEYVKQNLKYIKDDDYEQVPSKVDVWVYEDGICEEIEFLINNKGLIIDNTSTDKFYTAQLWGTLLSAKKDAFVVFYEISRNENNEIVDIDFNFVEHQDFIKTYNWC